MTKKLRIAFMGTPDFAAEALKALIASDHDIVAVYSQPPRPKGRGHKLQKSPVHLLAEQHDIDVYTPVSFKKEPEAVNVFEDLKLDLAIVAAYGLLLPSTILDAPKYGCLNIHASLLPRWRGAAPIHRAILAGDQESGITIMQMDQGLDTGDMLLKAATPITNETTALSLHDELAKIGADLALDAANKIAQTGERLSGEKQDDALANYAQKLSRDDGRINWNSAASDIERQIRALTPWPGVWCLDKDNKRIKIHGAAIAKESDKNCDKAGTTGTILDKSGHIICGENSVLQIIKIQPENAKAMDFASALNGDYLKIGNQLN